MSFFSLSYAISYREREKRLGLNLSGLESTKTRDYCDRNLVIIIKQGRS